MSSSNYEIASACLSHGAMCDTSNERHCALLLSGHRSSIKSPSKVISVQLEYGMSGSATLFLQIAAGRPLNEVDVDNFLTGRRAAQPGFIEPSFPTIAGSGPNGAIIHYRAQPGTCNAVTGSQLLLVDSGALCPIASLGLKIVFLPFFSILKMCQNPSAEMLQHTSSPCAFLPSSIR